MRFLGDRLDGCGCGGSRLSGWGWRLWLGCELRRWCGRLVFRFAADPEDQLHVVAETTAADASVQVVFTGRRYEVIVFARQKLQPAGLRRKRSEGNGEKHQFVRLVAYGYDARVRIGYPTRIVFFFAYIVYYVLFRILLEGSGSVDWTYNVYLVVFELCVTFVEVEYVIGIVYSEYTICRVPVYVEGFRVVTHHALDEEDEN